MQWKRESFYLYGLGEPATGEHYIWEFSHLLAACFNIFLNQFATTYAQDIHVLQLDNGVFHLSQYLRVPENIILLFQRGIFAEEGFSCKDAFSPHTTS